MVYDQSLDLYVPVMYVLMSGKTKECYRQVFSYIKGELPNCTPYCIGVDFEKAFFTAVSIYFPQALLTGCLFHFKQAARRKMEKLGIPDNEIKIAMASGAYDLLTVLPVDELDDKGIPFVETMIMDQIYEYHFKNKKELDDNTVPRWGVFWQYFR